ncbi:hypothetical protein BGZ99_008485 [Dissophora globulifera]|uniref:Uncharacterized protein n=1 Tax=Dissophora globulifera TaxID=979702 RepID=A0A9P6RVR6_9FUNG|nr:hypothetical protein BGZ99_008485 [Dissophora globulifera]
MPNTHHQQPTQLEQHEQHEQQGRQEQQQLPDPSQALLTGSQEHYLKKYLLGVLINSEIERLQKNPYETLPQLGGPFDLKDEHANSTTPFLRYLFESIVVPFPFLTSSKGALWPKLQRFMDEWAKIEAGNGVEREEIIRRKRLKNKGERSLVLMYSLAIKTTEQRVKEKKDLLARQQRIKEEKLLHEQQQDINVQDRLEKLDLTVDKDTRDNKHQRPTDGQNDVQADKTRSRSVSPSAYTSIIHGIRINVVGVRVVKEKRHVIEHEHALRHDFPHEELPVPPSKYTAKSGSAALRAAREKDRISLRGYLHNLAKVGEKIVKSSALIAFLTEDAIALSEDEAKDVQTRVALDEHRMAQQAKFDREVARKVDELDTQLKEVKLDLLQPGGISRLFGAFKHIDNVNNLPPLYQTVFEWGCMNFASTLYHVFTSSDDATLNFTQLKRTHMLLPYRTMWGILKISNPMAMMKGVMDLFLAQPFGSRSLMQRIISGNIQEEVSEYKKEITDIEAAIDDPGLCEKIRNYVYAPRSVISQIFPDDEIYDITELGLVMDVLRSDQIEPLLSPMQIKRVWDAQQKLEQDRLEQERILKQRQEEGIESDRSSGYSSRSNSSMSSLDEISSKNVQNDSQKQQQQQARLFSRKNHHGGNHHDDEMEPELNLIRQLQLLLVAHLRIRDKERLMGLIFQGVTGEIFKEVIAIFYEPLVKVYKSANVADSLMDVKYFADELIKIVEQAELNDNGQKDGPSTATLYLNLVRKHLPSFYKFVHAVHKQDDGIFHDLLEWLETIITFMRTGYGHPRIDYKTNEELRIGIDLNAFVKDSVAPEQWQQVQKEAQELTAYFTEVKERKKEEVRHMAGLDRVSQQMNTAGGSVDDSGDSSEPERLSEQERMAKELRGIGMQQEDLDDLEMINWHGGESGDAKGHGKYEDEGDDVDGEMGLKVPKVPTIDTLLQPFVGLMDKALFQTARE